MAVNIEKPQGKGSAKGVPPSLNEPLKQKNLNVPATSELVPLSLAIEAELKKELKVTSAETGVAIVQILKEGYQLWKKENGRI